MAERRMFAKKIVKSAKFIKMPVSSQNLFFHLGMDADDDGVVEAYTTMKTLGCPEDDLRVLVLKGFVRVLNEDLVAQITDWETNNLIRKDRYQPSIYKDLLLQINDGQPLVNHWLTEDSIGKDSIGKSNTKRFVPPTLEEINEYISKNNLNVNGETFYKYFTEGNWVDSKGNKVKNWKQKLITWNKNTTKPKEEIKPTYNTTQKVNVSKSELERMQEELFNDM